MQLFQRLEREGKMMAICSIDIKTTKKIMYNVESLDDETSWEEKNIWYKSDDFMGN